MTLKTLKDIGQDKNRKCCSVEEDYSNICEKCIKAEAVKWRKHMNPDTDVLDFIEEFFNLTEDLK